MTKARENLSRIIQVIKEHFLSGISDPDIITDFIMERAELTDIDKENHFYEFGFTVQESMKKVVVRVIGTLDLNNIN